MDLRLFPIPVDSWIRISSRQIKNCAFFYILVPILSIAAARLCEMMLPQLLRNAKIQSRHKFAIPIWLQKLTASKRKENLASSIDLAHTSNPALSNSFVLKVKINPIDVTDSIKIISVQVEFVDVYHPPFSISIDEQQ